MSSTLTSFSSTFSPTSTFTSSATPSPTQNNSNNSPDNSQSSFYKNLFYILIGLLAAFATVSLVSLIRARHRRNRITREAERLGLLVPGMDGYIPLRERQALRWTRADGTVSPEWWEIGNSSWLKPFVTPNSSNTATNNPQHPAYSPPPGLPPDSKGKSTLFTSSQPSSSFQPDSSDQIDNSDSLPLFLKDIKPLALFPPQSASENKPEIPSSELPYFPRHLAYRAEDLLPPPNKWAEEYKPEMIQDLAGKNVDLVTIIRMPEREWKSGSGSGSGGENVEEGEEVLREWSGISLGIVRVGVEGKITGNSDKREEGKDGDSVIYKGNEEDTERERERERERETVVERDVFHRNVRNKDHRTRPGVFSMGS